MFALRCRIEQAWKEGFDQQGCAHFGGKLVNKKLWIGTTEAAVFFRSLGRLLNDGLSMVCYSVLLCAPFCI